MDTEMFCFDEINWELIRRELWRRKVWIILITICFFAGACVYQQTGHIDRYTSKATVAVQSDEELSYDDFDDSREYARAYVSAFKGNRMLSHAKAKADITSGGISISAFQREGTNLVEVTVTASDPQTAYDVMEAVVNHYGEVVESMYLEGEAYVVQTATEAVKVSGEPGLKRPVIIALIGLVGSMVLVAAGELLKNTVKTQKCAERRFSGRCLGIVSKVTGKEMLSIDADSADAGFVDDIYRIANQVERQMQAAGKRSLLVSSSAKSEGVTTVAKNLAIALKEKGRAVELIDCSLSENPEDLIAECSQKADYIIVDAKSLSESIGTEILSYEVDATLLVVKQDCTKLKDIQETLWKLEESASEYLGYVLNGWTTAR